MSKTTRPQAPEVKPLRLPFDAAFHATAAERAALAEKDLLPLNIDVRIAATKVLGALPHLAMLRGAIAESLPHFDLVRFDRLEAYAQALAYAHGSFLAASGPEEALPGLAARGSRIRQQLVTDGRALARRGLLDGRLLDALKGTTGYLNIASDLSVLARILRERWSDIRSSTAIQPAELDEAEQIFVRMTNAYAARAPGSPEVAAIVADRQRAFTLLVRAYDQARRAAIYLRWDEDDADAILPSLWARRKRRRARTKKAGAALTAHDATARAEAGDGGAVGPR